MIVPNPAVGGRLRANDITPTTDATAAYQLGMEDALGPAAEIAQIAEERDTYLRALQKIAGTPLTMPYGANPVEVAREVLDSVG